MARTKQDTIIRNGGGGDSSGRQTAKKSHYSPAAARRNDTPVSTQRRSLSQQLATKRKSMGKQLATKRARVRPHYKELPPVKMQKKRYHKKGLNFID
jgi:hypothetical protein